MLNAAVAGGDDCWLATQQPGHEARLNMGTMAVIMENYAMYVFPVSARCLLALFGLSPTSDDCRHCSYIIAYTYLPRITYY